MINSRLANLCLLLTLALGQTVAGQGDGLGLGGVLGGSEQTQQDDLFYDSRDRVAVDVKLSDSKVTPDGDFFIAVVISPDDGWHVYTGPDQGDLPEEYYRTRVIVELPAGSPLTVHADWKQWPDISYVDFLGDMLPVYEGQSVVFVPVTVAPDAASGQHTLTVKTAFQVCDDFTCLAPTPYPPDAGDTPADDWTSFGQTVTIAVSTPAEAAGGEDTGAFWSKLDASVMTEIRGGATAPKTLPFDVFGWKFTLTVTGAGFLLLLLVAAIGGFLLNLTPCVLPVIPIKIMSLSAHAANRKQMLGLGVAMAAGIVAFWMVLAVAIAAVTKFTAINQLFQYPLFTIGVGLVIALMAIGMCGLFSVRLPNFVYAFNPQHDSLGGSFFFGVMTAILSTPCTAPLMGAAAAYAATIHPAKTLIIFGAIGFGMASPYLVLATAPHLVDRMPRTGPASELIKHVMGLLMLAAAAFFIGTGISGLLQKAPEPPSVMYWWVVSALGVAAGVWLGYKTLRITTHATRRMIFGGLGVLITCVSILVGVALTDKGPIDWIYYTPGRFEDAKQQGNVVVMEFTAEWCLNCKFLEKTVLRNTEVVALFESGQAVPIKVDLTGKNTDGNAMLKDVERLTIPLLVVFGANGDVVFKGDFYTPDQVLDAVHEAGRVSKRP